MRFLVENGLGQRILSLKITAVLVTLMIIFGGSTIAYAQAVILNKGQNAASVSFDFCSSALEFSEFFAGPQTATQDRSFETTHYRLTGTLGGRFDAGVDFWTTHNSDRDYLGFDVEFLIVKNRRILLPLSIGLYSQWKFTTGSTKRQFTTLRPGLRLYIKAPISRSAYIMPFIGGGPVYYSYNGNNGKIAMRSGFMIYNQDKANMYFSLWPYIEFYDEWNTLGIGATVTALL